MGSVATEKERGTAALILTKPASRAAFLIAKIVAIATTLGISTAIAAAGAWFYTFVLFEPLPVAGFVAATILQWLALVTYAAITFLGSTLTRSALAAAGLGVAAFIVLGILSIVPAIGHYLPIGLGVPARGLALGQGGVDVLGPAIASVVPHRRPHRRRLARLPPPGALSPPRHLPRRQWRTNRLELGWPMGLEPITFGSTFRCSAY